MRSWAGQIRRALVAGIHLHAYIGTLARTLTVCAFPWGFPGRYDVPLVADIHFQPAVALMVADAFEKIRVNPGNFADGRKTFEVINYDDPAQFRAEQEHIAEVYGFP